MFSWGHNSCGHLGINDTTDQNIPIKVNLSNDIIIKSISCGQSHSLLLSTDEDVYEFWL